MDAVWQKIWADLSSRGLISGLIVITIAAASTLLTLAWATLTHIDAPYDRAFADLNGAHLWLYFDRDRVRSRDVEQVAGLVGIAEGTGLQHSVHTRAQIGDSRVWVSLRLMPESMPEVNRLLIQAGRYLSAGQSELLASKDLHDLYGLQVGETIQVSRSDGKKVDLPVVGLAYNPTWDTYRNSQPPYVYVGEQTMRALFPDEARWEWSMGLRLADPEAVDIVLARVEAALPSDAVAGHTDWRDVKESAIFGAQINFVFLGTFGFFAILATVLVIATSIGSAVLAQFKQIGMLKAVGFTQIQVLILYLGQYLALGLLGGLLGLLLGVALSPLPLQGVAVSLSTTYQPPLSVEFVGLILAIVLAIVAAAAFGAAWRGSRVNIIKAIATGAEVPRKKLFWGVRLATWLGLPMVFVLGLNDVFVRPFRSLLTGLNLVLGVIGIIFGLALNETLKTYRENPALLGIVYDAVVSREQTGHSRTQSLLRRAADVEAFYGEHLVDAETVQGQSFQLRAVEGAFEAFDFQVTGTFFQPNTTQTIAGQGLLDWLGLDVGDELTLILDDEDRRPVTFEIVGTYPEPVNAGQMMIVSLPAITRVLGHVEPYRYYVKLIPGADTERLRHDLAPRPNADLSVTLVEQAIPDVVIYLQLAILVLAAILIGIALINVFNTSWLATQEKTGVIGVLKAVGMTPAQVVVMVCTASGFLGLLAICLGIPLGLFSTQGMLDMLSSAYGFGEVRVQMDLFYTLLLIPFMVLTSVVGSLIPARRAARSSIVKVLHYE